MPIDVTKHPQNYDDRPQQIWLAPGTGEAYVSEQAAWDAHDAHRPEEITLHRPSLQPIYGGPTLLEALWAEMDRLMEALMTGVDAEDGGDKYRAQELAWVLAIVTNAYDPSVDRIRAEAMRRWNEEQA